MIMGDLETLESASFFPPSRRCRWLLPKHAYKNKAFTGVSAGVHVRIPARKSQALKENGFVWEATTTTEIEEAYTHGWKPHYWDSLFSSSHKIKYYPLVSIRKLLFCSNCFQKYCLCSF